MANIKFEYLYRDEGNYKTFDEIVFYNPGQLSIEVIRKSIESHLIDGCCFDPDAWHIPRFSFHQLNAFGMYDYLWYEFEGLAYTEADASGSINDFLKGINNPSLLF